MSEGIFGQRPNSVVAHCRFILVGFRFNAVLS